MQIRARLRLPVGDGEPGGGGGEDELIEPAADVTPMDPGRDDWSIEPAGDLTPIDPTGNAGPIESGGGPRLIDTAGDVKFVEASGEAIRMGRHPDCEIQLDPEAYRRVSGLHARIEPGAGGFVLVPLSKNNRTFLNDAVVASPSAVRDGDVIRLGFSGPVIEIIALTAVETARSSDDSGETVRVEGPHRALLLGSAHADRLPIGAGGVIGREKSRVQFLLDHPHVSRLHASLAVHAGRVVLSDLGSANGTYVNGQRIARPTDLDSGDHIDIGPFSLEFDHEALESRSRSNNVELAARGLTRVVRDFIGGKSLVLMDDVSLVVRPREFVCILGPSGAGKSTLLSMLSGRMAPDDGAVRVNGQDLRANFAALKQDIAVVPQREVLHDSLTVGSALAYTAELRLPPDTGREEIERNVDGILETVGLSKRRGTLLRNLSGGQLKRVSLANELMARPSLLFLDEVTSGLDEQTDRELMELFRQVAESGKTVVCITHSLANVEAACHLVAVLAEGGRLAFFGTPEETRSYFEITRLGDVYRKLAERPAQSWQEQFRSSPLYGRYVAGRLPATAAPQRVAPRSEHFTLQALVNPIRQAWVLTRRYAAVWRGDPWALATMLGQPLLIAVLLAAVFGRLDAEDRTPKTFNLLFLLNVACFWFGCNNAAKELVKERIIYRRERDFNLRIDSYLASKFVILALIAIVQVLILFGIVKWWCDPGGPGAKQWAILTGLALAGTSLGVLISSCARTEEVAAALVPLAVLPQIILSDVVARLSGAVQWGAKILVSSYWGTQGLQSLLPSKELLGVREEANFGEALAVVAAHAIVFAGLTWLTLWRDGRSKLKKQRK